MKGNAVPLFDLTISDIKGFIGYKRSKGLRIKRKPLLKASTAHTMKKGKHKTKV